MCCYNDFHLFLFHFKKMWLQKKLKLQTWLMLCVPRISDLWHLFQTLILFPSQALQLSALFLLNTPECPYHRAFVVSVFSVWNALPLISHRLLFPVIQDLLHYLATPRGQHHHRSACLGPALLSFITVQLVLAPRSLLCLY